MHNEKPEGVKYGKSIFKRCHGGCDLGVVEHGLVEKNINLKAYGYDGYIRE